ncbi:hypothetical protein Caci_4147 [Catenulispora acidiphila DSM 44928]|uniref:Ferredoxin n=1 Tax=Catenulispora acidiphila (strain DSM 44928 / JCM 14897 / NBRC 102108 / NRRL B-24433 / ID139908) TaxID=479433 RepID=C7QGG6_CATAD|nr:hypothetical protein [Catenulispora acidiphila]ACU73011.1 hypothetical protein Caci_4147 [Catenulispora acidiphila DSM 44928]
MITYWNPLPTARRLVDTDDRDPFTGKWAERKPRNVPGPFYSASTDSLQTGRLDAPDHIAYDDDLGGGFGWEFVYRQPVNAAGTEAVVNAARLELYSGYACDGDDHWTVEAVRDWWRERGEIRAWAVDLAVQWEANAHPKYRGHYHDAAHGLREFIAFIDDGLDRYLRGYMFWLAEGCSPEAGRLTPDL